MKELSIVFESPHVIWVMLSLFEYMGLGKTRIMDFNYFLGDSIWGALLTKLINDVVTYYHFAEHDIMAIESGALAYSNVKLGVVSIGFTAVCHADYIWPIMFMDKILVLECKSVY